MTKVHIPLRIKKQVWFRDCFEIDMRVCQCKTCSNLCLMPESIRKSIRFAPIYTEHTVSGVGEFGHVIAEHNGGCPTVDNLFIQCKSCNVRQATKTMDIRQIDQLMLDLNIFNDTDIDDTNDINSSDMKDMEDMEDMEDMDTDFYGKCSHYISKYLRNCKKLAIEGHEYCSIHLI